MPISVSFRRLMILIAAVLLLGSPLSSVRAEVVLIFHPSLASQDFSATNLTRIYAMRTRVWSDGTPILVYISPDDATVHTQFVHHFLHMQPYQLERYWHRLVFSGTGSMPTKVESGAAMIRAVAQTPGAIGYVDSDQVETMGALNVGTYRHE